MSEARASQRRRHRGWPPPIRPSAAMLLVYLGRSAVVSVFLRSRSFSSARSFVPLLASFFANQRRVLVFLSFLFFSFFCPFPFSPGSFRSLFVSPRHVPPIWYAYLVPLVHARVTLLAVALLCSSSFCSGTFFFGGSRSHLCDRCRNIAGILTANRPSSLRYKNRSCHGSADLCGL